MNTAPKQVSIVTNAGVQAFDRVQAFEDIFRDKGITVVKKVIFDESANTKSMLASGYLEELRSTARGFC